MKVLNLKEWGGFAAWAGILSVVWGGAEVQGAGARGAMPYDLPKVRHHFLEGSEADWVDWLDLDNHFRKLQEEKRRGEWFAALTSQTPGSRGVIASLWNVDDRSSADFIEIFYKQINSGKSPAESLHQAKISFIESPRVLYDHPYYWAPFIFVGSE